MQLLLECAARQLLLPRGLMLVLEAQGSATLTWETERPYESAITVPAGARAVVKGLKVRHKGKSVANNYAIYSAGAKASSTGHATKIKALSCIYGYLIDAVLSPLHWKSNMWLDVHICSYIFILSVLV